MNLSRNRLESSVGDPLRALSLSIEKLDLSYSPTLRGTIVAELILNLHKLSVLNLEGQSPPPRLPFSEGRRIALLNFFQSTPGTNHIFRWIRWINFPSINSVERNRSKGFLLEKLRGRIEFRVDVSGDRQERWRHPASKVRRLTKFPLPGIGLYDLPAATFSPLTNLRQLYLNNNRFSEFRYSLFQELRKLEVLNISYNNLKFLRSSIIRSLNDTNTRVIMHDNPWKCQKCYMIHLLK